MMTPIFAILLAIGIMLGNCTSIDDLPMPMFSINVTQDNNVGVEKRVTRRLAATEEDIAPLFEGLGTHYSFIWVGTPAQRVSVIMDTGSHHTAFPCTGCKCGKHMDPHFDPKKSSTNSIKSCGAEGKKCYFKQSYTEGSSWSAFKVRDKVFVGGPGVHDIEAAQHRAVDFDFGCQESETGLFRTQKVDGIMGLSAAPDTLPYQLHAAGVTKTKMFALCFRTGGGVVTLGGVDTSLHATPTRGLSQEAVERNRTSNGGVFFAAMIKPKGWYTVKLLDVLMRPSVEGDGASSATSIGGDASRFSTGKGTIVDSGTTDTYLPSAVRAQFQNLFRSLTGREYSNKQSFYTKEQFSKLPIIVYRLQGAEGVGTVDLEVQPSSYMELHRERGEDGTVGVTGAAGRYTPRIYLTEGSGAVLGANSINEHNVIFDPDNLRVGFARSRCSYSAAHSSHDFASSTNNVPAAQSNKAKAAKPAKPPSSPSKSSSSTSSSSSSNSKNTPKTAVSRKPSIATGNVVKPPVVIAKFPLTPVQSSALSSALNHAAENFVTSRLDACKPLLAVPCDARCTHTAFTAPVEEAEEGAEPSMMEYLTVNSAGQVRVRVARKVTGQQYWRVPACPGARRASNSNADGALQSADLRFEDLAFPVESDGGRGKDRTVMEKCSVMCPVPEPGSPGDADSLLPVRINPVYAAVEDAPTQCDADTHTQLQLQIYPQRTQGAPSADQKVVILQSPPGSRRPPQCVLVENAAAVKSDAGKVAEEIARQGLGVRCLVASVVTAPCKPYSYNCTSSPRLERDGQRAKADAVPTGAQDVVLVASLGLKGLPGIGLTQQQSADLVLAFAKVFQVPQSSVSIALAPSAESSAAPTSFSLRLGGIGGGAASVLVFLRIDASSSSQESPNSFVPAPFLLPKEVAQIITRISGSPAYAGRGRSQVVQTALVREQLQAYLQAVLEHPQFPTVLAMAVADAIPRLSPTAVGVDSVASRSSGSSRAIKNRPAWLVSSAVQVRGAAVLLGRIDSTSSGGDRLRGDALNAEICAAIASPWKSYLNFQAPELGSHMGGAWLLYSLATALAVCALAAAVCVLRRRYLRDRGRTSSSDSAADADSSGSVGSVEEARSPRSGGVPSGIGATRAAHWDKRRKVLQKFSFRK